MQGSRCLYQVIHLICLRKDESLACSGWVSLLPMTCGMAMQPRPTVTLISMNGPLQVSWNTGWITCAVLPWETAASYRSKPLLSSRYCLEISVHAGFSILRYRGIAHSRVWRRGRIKSERNWLLNQQFIGLSGFLSRKALARAYTSPDMASSPTIPCQGLFLPHWRNRMGLECPEQRMPFPEY